MITITKGAVSAETFEGIKKSMPLNKFVSRITPPQLDLVLPDGVKVIRWRRNTVLVVYEMGPGAHSLGWDEHDCGIKKLTLALPYVVLMIPFHYQDGNLNPNQVCVECYFRNAPITDIEDELFYPALLNCGYAVSDLPLPSWLCTTRLNWPKPKLPTNSACLWNAIATVKNHLLGATFNGEWSMHWDQYCGWHEADPRITDVSKWAKATKKDPSFILGVKWRPAEKNLRRTIEHTLSTLAARQPQSLEKIILNQ